VSKTTNWSPFNSIPH